MSPSRKKGSKSKKGTLIYEGKTKRLYATEDPDLIIQEFTDDITASDGKKRGVIKGKGIVNNRISAYIFEYLSSYHIPTHFEKSISERAMLVKRLNMLPIKVVVRNIASGDFCHRYNIEEGKNLEQPILEFYLKNDSLSDPMINKHHATALGLAKPEEVDTITRYALKINAILKSFFLRRNVQLMDSKLEFGRYRDRLLLADEISPDTCHLWDVESGEKLDRDRFCQDLAGAEETYQEILKRVLKIS